MMLDLLSIVVVLLAGAIYLLPLIVGLARGAPDIGSVAVINVLFGWTLVGWVASLALALRSVPPSTTVMYQLPPPPPPTGWAGPLPPQPGSWELPPTPPPYGPDDPTDLG
jgi:Superinfection immunity protein